MERALHKMSNEQRAAIKFCAGNGFSVKKTMEMLRNIYGDSTMKKSAVYEWYGRFRSGQQETTDNARSGRLVSSMPSNVVTIKTLLDKDRRMTIRM